MKNFKHISIKVRNTNVTIKNFKTKLMKKACKLLYENTRKQLNKNYDSSALANSEEREEYAQMAKMLHIEKCLIQRLIKSFLLKMH